MSRLSTHAIAEAIHDCTFHEAKANSSATLPPG